MHAPGELTRGIFYTRPKAEMDRLDIVEGVPEGLLPGPRRAEEEAIVLEPVEGLHQLHRPGVGGLPALRGAHLDQRPPPGGLGLLHLFTCDAHRRTITPPTAERTRPRRP